MTRGGGSRVARFGARMPSYRGAIEATYWACLTAFGGGLENGNGQSSDTQFDLVSSHHIAGLMMKKLSASNAAHQMRRPRRMPIAGTPERSPARGAHRSAPTGTFTARKRRESSSESSGTRSAGSTPSRAQGHL